MSNKEKCKNEVVVCNTLFKFELIEECSDTFELVVTPCNTPTAVFDIARITKRTNACSGLDFFQAVINTDPVEIIQDCDLENLIQKANDLIEKVKVPSGGQAGQILAKSTDEIKAEIIRVKIYIPLNP